MLRFSGEVLDGVAGYTFPGPHSKREGGSGVGENGDGATKQVDPSGEKKENEKPPKDEWKTTLTSLLQFLDTLDRAWLAILRSQIWDTASGRGVDMLVSSSQPQSPATLQGNLAGLQLGGGTAGGVSQTDRTRLRSILLLGTERMEEWMDGGVLVVFSNEAEGEDEFGLDEDEEDEDEGIERKVANEKRQKEMETETGQIDIDLDLNPDLESEEAKGEKMEVDEPGPKLKPKESRRERRERQAWRRIQGVNDLFSRTWREMGDVV
jgi:hypothetical protein